MTIYFCTVSVTSSSSVTLRDAAIFFFFLSGATQVVRRLIVVICLPRSKLNEYVGRSYSWRKFCIPLPRVTLSSSAFFHSTLALDITVTEASPPLNRIMTVIFSHYFFARLRFVRASGACPGRCTVLGERQIDFLYDRPIISVWCVGLLCKGP